MFSYFRRTAQARLCGLIWQVKPQVSNELKHLLKSELALSHWALTMCLKLNPCLIALFNKTGITGMLSQHQWLGNLALLLSEQSKRLWRGNLSLKHWREFSSGYYSSCASSSAAVRITWQTQIISVLTEHRALLVAVTSSERNKVSVCLLEVPSCCSNSLQSPQFLRAEHAQWERLGKERLRKGALKFWGG